jgi:hypothetical protein
MRPTRVALSHCVGTEFGSRHIRLVTADRLNVEF